MYTASTPTMCLVTAPCALYTLCGGCVSAQATDCLAVTGAFSCSAAGCPQWLSCPGLRSVLSSTAWWCPGVTRCGNTPTLCSGFLTMDHCYSLEKATKLDHSALIRVLTLPFLVLRFRARWGELFLRCWFETEYLVLWEHFTPPCNDPDWIWIQDTVSI